MKKAALFIVKVVGICALASEVILNGQDSTLTFDAGFKPFDSLNTFTSIVLYLNTSDQSDKLIVSKTYLKSLEARLSACESTPPYPSSKTCHVWELKTNISFLGFERRRRLPPDPVRWYCLERDRRSGERQAYGKFRRSDLRPRLLSRFDEHCLVS